MRSLIPACYVPRAIARVQRGKEAEGFRSVRKPAVNSVVAVVFNNIVVFKGEFYYVSPPSFDVLPKFNVVSINGPMDFPRIARPAS